MAEADSPKSADGQDANAGQAAALEREKYALLRYEQATRLTSAQRDALNEIRSRTGLLISAATISTSFLGSVGAKGKHGFPLEFLWALIPFGVSVLLAIVILLPILTWKFDLNSASFTAVEGQDYDRILSDLSNACEENAAENQNRLNGLYILFSVSAFAMLWSIVAWITIIE
jgi:hypothetical protein